MSTDSEKLQKLIRLYWSALKCGVIGEAEAALHMIHKLQKKMKCHVNLDNEKTDHGFLVKNIIITEKRISPWLIRLGQAVSELFSVQLILNHGTVATSESLQLNGCSDDVERAKDLFNFLKTEILASAREFRLNEKQTGLQFRSFAKGCSDAAYDYCHEKSTLLKKDIFQQQAADEIKTIKATPFHRFVYKSMDRYSYRCGRIKGLELIKSTTKIQ